MVLAGKVTVVTGAARGVGKNIARELLREGATVYIGSRSQSDADSAVADLLKHGDVRTLVGSITDAAECARMADEVGNSVSGVHLLVNNAAASATAPMPEIDMAAWDMTFAANVKAPFLMSRAFLPLLSAEATHDAKTSIINISSISGLIIDGLPSWAYSSSKAALNHLTRGLALEFAPVHVNVNALALGPFETEKSQELGLIASRIPSKLRNPLSSPQRRTGLGEHAGGTVVFLASPAGSYITGAILPVDGGIATTR
ncbi:MAG: SDR family oxidoreductase [Actinomycetota bacterium]|nr:SDR family oxidoreductase [Actinomycetota bacterium]